MAPYPRPSASSAVKMFLRRFAHRCSPEGHRPPLAPHPPPRWMSISEAGGIGAGGMPGRRAEFQRHGHHARRRRPFNGRSSFVCFGARPVVSSAVGQPVNLALGWTGDAGPPKNAAWPVKPASNFPGHWTTRWIVVTRGKRPEHIGLFRAPAVVRRSHNASHLIEQLGLGGRHVLLDKRF